MALGNLLDKLKGKEKELPESFLALVLTSNLVHSAVWQIVEGKTQIVSLGTPVEWDGDVATTNELVQAVDATISTATEGLESEPVKTIFGLANSWVDLKGILGSKKELIKAICKDLELKPLGYVVLSDCILKYLRMQEGAPTTSLLIQISKRELVLSLVKLGRIESSIVTPASDNLVEAVTSAISQLPEGDPFPSRFILVGSMENTSELVQELTAYDWVKKFHFLHTPKIEALPKDVEVHATAVAGGTEVATSLGIVFDSPTITPESEESVSTGTAQPFLLSAEDIGFTTTANLDEPVITEATVAQETELEPQKTPLPTIKQKKLRISLPKLKLSKLNLPTIHPPLIRIIVPLILLIIGILNFLYFVPKASLTLLVRAKPLEQVISLNLSAAASSLDFDNRTVPAVASSQTVSGTKSTPATGEKTIGNPAKGEVTIYNRTSLSKTFLSGTTLTSGNLKFVLDEDVTIASKSAGLDYVDVPGKATAKITAKTIGAESNLAAGSEFTLATFGKDSYVAKNDLALSGGSSQLVTIVSAVDKKTLISDLTKDLLTQLKNNLAVTNGTAYYILESEALISEEQYTKKVGEEASTLDGTITLTVPVLKYQTRDVESLLGSEINKSIPVGYSRTSLTPSVTLEKSKVLESGIVQADARVTVYVVPELDFDNLKKKLKGHSSSSAQQLLHNLPSYVDDDIVITPRFLPPRFQFFPLNPNNITISVTPSI